MIIIKYLHRCFSFASLSSFTLIIPNHVLAESCVIDGMELTEQMLSAHITEIELKVILDANNNICNEAKDADLRQQACDFILRIQNKTKKLEGGLCMPQQVSAVLKQMRNLCYGHESQFAPDYEWHKCTNGSY